MRVRFFSLFVVSLFFILFSETGFAVAAADEILIRNVSVIDTERETPRIVKGNVVIRNGLISYVGKKRPAVSEAASVIDGKGKFLIPSLIDSHTHLANIAGLNWKQKDKYPELARAYYRQLPRSYLYFGYTTLIDVNNHSPDILEPILKQTVRPEIQTCGEQLEVMNGFMMAETKPADRLKRFPGFLYDRYNKSVVIPGTIDLKEHTAAASVSRIVGEQGGKCVKMAFEDGFGGTEDVTWEMPSKPIVREVAAEAKKAHVPLLLHASSYESQRFAVDTETDIIAHGMWHWGMLKDFLDVKKLPETHRELLLEIARKRIGYQPTFRVIAGQRDVFDDRFVNDPNLENVYPPEFLEWLKTDEGHWQQKQIKQYAKGFFDGKSNREIMDFMQLLVDKIAVSTHLLADNDANLLLGSDTPSSNTHTNPPGYNGYLEMREWHAAGVPLERILRAATIDNARAFQMDKTHGSIRSGKAANVLLLRKNPLKDISAYDSIERVFIGGKVFLREEFSAKRGFFIDH